MKRDIAFLGTSLVFLALVLGCASVQTGNDQHFSSDPSVRFPPGTIATALSKKRTKGVMHDKAE